MNKTGAAFRGRYRGQSRQGLVHCNCLLMTQSGHSLFNWISETATMLVLCVGDGNAAARFHQGPCERDGHMAVCNACTAVRARLGFLPIDNLLLFGTGGFAYGRLERTASFSYPGSGYGLGIGGPPNVNCNAPATCFAGSSSDVATGWTVGGGVEYAVWQRWTVKAEYLYVSLKGDSVTEVALGVTQPASLTATFGRANFNIARVGANYRF